MCSFFTSTLSLLSRLSTAACGRVARLTSRSRPTPKAGAAHRPDVEAGTCRMQSSEYRCRDEGVIPAPRLACFEILMDLSTYARWWTLVAVTPVVPHSRLNAGTRFRFLGVRPGGQRFEWSVQVLEVESPVRIELAYTGGEYIGRTAWELAELGNVTRVAY